MVGYEKDKERLSISDYAFAGGTAGVITRALSQPLDVIKIRMQLQVEPVSKESAASKYRSIIQAASSILKEEGIVGLWKGHNPGQLLSLTYGLVQFSTFEWATSTVGKVTGVEQGPIRDFVCGGLAGLSATLVSFPFDVIRTRFIAQGNSKTYKMMFDGFLKMFNQEGILSMWRGMSPTMVQIAPHAGTQFAVYTTVVSTAKKFDFLTETKNDVKELTVPANLVSGGLAGAVAKSFVYPFDLARKRLQLQGFQSARIGFGENFFCQGLAHCLRETYAGEGVRGLFKGLSPSLIKAAVTTALHFTAYNQTLQAISRFRNPSKDS